MPRLCRLRLVSVGHPSARFGDVTLDFRDKEGAATHSSLWLRNGGGKSSLLNLFFASVRPNRREFLGAKGEAGKRKLEDYVLSTDSSAIIAEWQLDAASGSLDYGLSEHFLTGIFFERSQSGRPAASVDGTDSSDIRRLFFAGLTSKAEPELTLEGLPLFSGEGAARNRRKLSNFRQQWLSLRDRFPQQELAAIDDNQRAWQDLLNSRGIDPELYYYQIRMNEREGGADQVFIFEDAEEFCDFLLGMVLNPDEIRPVRDNVAAFQQQLLRRKEQLLPEQELCRRLLQPVASMCEVLTARDNLRNEAKAVSTRVTGLSHRLQARLAFWVAVAREATQGMEAEQQATAKTLGESAEAQRRAAVMEKFCCQRRLDDAIATLDAAQEVMQKGAEAEAIWEAAVPLHQALQHERTATGYREQLRKKRADFAPLLAELTSAGTSLIAALRYNTEQLRSAADASRTAAEEAGNQAQTHETASTLASRAAASASTKADNLRDRLKTGQDARRALELAGILMGNERAEHALTRIASRCKALDKTSAAALAELETVEQRMRDAAEARQVAAVEEHALSQDVHQAQKSLESAIADRRSQEQDETLKRLLDLEEIQLQSCLDQAVRRSQDERGRIHEQILGLRLEAAMSERALRALEDHGLLPPSPDVQKVLEALRSRLPAAWSGWEHACANFANNADRRQFVCRQPHLAAGILVRNEDYELAKQVLLTADVALEQPVVVAPLAALESDVPIEAVVVGPTGEALFDRSAATRELHAIRTRNDRRDQEEDDLRRWEVAVERVNGLLVRFAESYPAGWFDAQRQRIEQLTAKRAAAKEREDKAQQHLDKLTKRQQEMRDIQRQSSDELRKLDGERIRIEHFHQEHESQQESLEHDLQVQIGLADSQHVEAERLKSLAAEARENQQALQSGAQTKRHEASNCEAERTQIKYGDAKAAASEGDIGSLRLQFESLKLQYEQQVGADTLEALAIAEDGHARQCRERLKRVLQEHVSLTSERIAQELATLPARQPVDVRHKEAAASHFEAKQAKGNATRTRNAAQEAFNAASARCQALAQTGTLEDADATLSPEEASRIAGECQAKADALALEARRHEESAEEFEHKSAEAKHIAEMLGKDADTLSATIADAGSLISTADQSIGSSQDDGLADEEFGKAVREVTSALSGLRTRHQALDGKRNEIASGIYREVRNPAYASIRNSIAPRFSEFAEDAMESRSCQLREELELRIQTIQADIDEADRHRNLIVQQVLAAAEDALRSLRSAASSSRLPDTLTHVGGKQFLRITTSEPSNPVERRSRVAELVETLVSQGEIPNEVKLIQMAVRRVGRPIHVRVLHPDPDRAGDTVDITEMNRLSGGERLTSAILLYCTLAQLRARNRGQLRRPSSVLLLDNPIGRASRPRFIEIQREFAEQMQVQLVYATGVNDLEAIAMLPNIIRLRNDRVDRNTGHHLVEHVPPGHSQAGMIEAVRIGRVIVQQPIQGASPAGGGQDLAS